MGATVSLGASAERTRERIISLCQSGLDAATLGTEVLKQLQRVVPFEEPCWLTTDPFSSLITGAIWENFPAWAAEALVYLESAEGFNNIRDLARSSRQVGILSEVTEGDLHRSLRYGEVFAPLGFGDHIRAALVTDGSCWGSLTLQRERTSRPFSPAEAAFVAQITKHLAEAMRSALTFGSITTQQKTDGPGLLVLGKDFSVMSITPMAQLWLDEMLDDGLSHRENKLPHAIYTAVSTLHTHTIGATEKEPAFATPRVRLRTRSGRWLIVHASRLIGQEAEEQAAVLIEPAHPEELAPLIVAAYGLTGREQEIARLILRGFATAEIVEQLHITTNTVQDHLKAIFYKVGVRSRRELVAQILAHQYQPDNRAESELYPQ